MYPTDKRDRLRGKIEVTAIKVDRIVLGSTIDAASWRSKDGGVYARDPFGKSPDWGKKTSLLCQRGLR